MYIPQIMLVQIFLILQGIPRHVWGGLAVLANPQISAVSPNCKRKTWKVFSDICPAEPAPCHAFGRLFQDMGRSPKVRVSRCRLTGARLCLRSHLPQGVSLRVAICEMGISAHLFTGHKTPPPILERQQAPRSQLLSVCNVRKMSSLFKMSTNRSRAI